MKEKIGGGAFGEAWKVSQISDNNIFIMKKVSAKAFKEKEKEMARNEIRNLKKCNHKNIVKYFDNFYEKQCFLIVMEYCSGGDLEKAIKAQGGKPFTEKIVKIWFRQLCSSIEYLQKNKIIHRDLKPANVFLTKELEIKIGDFGLAKNLERTSNMALTHCGTPLYMAVEVLNGQPYNHKADVWSLGCILYEICTLKMAFSNLGNIFSGQYTSISPNVHPEVSPIVKLLLQQDPARRPSADKIMERYYI